MFQMKYSSYVWLQIKSYFLKPSKTDKNLTVALLQYFSRLQCLWDDLNSKIEADSGKLTGKPHIFSFVLPSDNVIDTAEEQMLYEMMKF